MYWQYLDDYSRHREELLAIADRVFSSGRLILGNEVAAFEKSFSAYCGVSYGVGVNSGTDALFLALKALGIEHGEEVITVSNTAVPTVAAIRAAGARPVFVDVERDTFLMDVKRIPALLNRKTRCLMPVHLFGQPVDMAPLREIAEQKHLFIIEDCAQAAGADYRGSKVGGLGTIGAFSFYPTKILGAFGDGGLVMTGREDLYGKLKRLRFYGMEKAYYSEEEGYNSRLDEIQAAILKYRLGQLDESVSRRRAVADRYSEGLQGLGDIEVPAVKNDRSHQFYAYTIKTEFRDKLMQFLRENGVETRINYPVPVHLMRGYRCLGYPPGSLPVTERLSSEILSLPMHPGLTSKDADTVISLVRSFFCSPPGRAAQ